jgi:hypothetical protein
MSGVEIGVALTILTDLAAQAYKISCLIEKAQAEGRKITDEEWATLEAAQKKAHDSLSASIKDREADEIAGD